MTVSYADDTPSPNEPIPKPDCDGNMNVSIRYSNTSERLYIESDSGERGGCVTIGEIWEVRDGKSPLYAIDPDSGEMSDNATGTWLLTQSLYVEDGITLKVRLDWVMWASSIVVRLIFVALVFRCLLYCESTG